MVAASRAAPPAASTTTSCSVPSGYAILSTDCDDSDPFTYSGAVPKDYPVFSGIPWDCKTDRDGDQRGDEYATGPALPGSDCDDTDPLNYFGNYEVCDGQDNDCDNLVDNVGSDDDRRLVQEMVADAKETK